MRSILCRRERPRAWWPMHERGRSRLHQTLLCAGAAVSLTLTAFAQPPAPSFNAARAMQYTREVAAFGPRPIGSANHKKLENYILAHLKGDKVEDDAFTAATPEGNFPVRNLIAKFPGTRDGVIVIAGHYDTN